MTSILIVDDEIAIAEVLASILSDAGGENGLDTFVEGRWRHNDIVTS